MVLISDFYIVVIGRVLSIFTSILSVRILTSQMDIEQVGFYYILQTVIMLINFSLLNSVGQYFNRNVHDSYYNGFLNDVSNRVIFIRALLVIVSIVPIILIYFLYDYSALSSLHVFLSVILISLAGGTSLVFLEVLNILEDRVFYTVTGLVQLIFGVIFAVFLTHYYFASASIWLVGVAVVQILFFPIIWLRVKKLNRDHVRTIDYEHCFTYKNIRGALIFIIPVSCILLFQWGQSSAYRLILSDKYSIEVIGFVAIGIAVANAIFMAVETIIGQYLGPKYYKAINNKNKDIRSDVWNAYAKIVFPIYVTTFFFVIFLSKEILVLLVDDKFHSGWSFVIVGALIEFFRANSNVLYMVTTSEVKSKNALLPYMVGFLLVLFLLYVPNFNKVPIYSMLLISFSYVVMFSVLFFTMRRMLYIKLPLLLLLKACALSFVFSCSLFFNSNGEFIYSLLKVFSFGTGYLAINYYLVRSCFPFCPEFSVDNI